MVQESAAPVDMSRWNTLFEWSMKFQDGTRPSNSELQQLTPERREWLERALKEGMQDFVQRMKQIKGALDAAAGSDADHAGVLREQEQMLEELQEIVESVDHARDLHSIGGLPTLLSLLSSPAPSLRSRAAEVVATCAANNPPVQRWMMQEGAMPPLLDMLGDCDRTAAAKALLALSALMRHYDPAMESFRLADGLHKLLMLLPQETQEEGGSGQEQASTSAQEDTQQQRQQQERLLRKSLNLLQYVLSKHPTDSVAVATAMQRLFALLDKSSWSEGTRQGALQVLLELAQHPDTWAQVRDAPGLQHSLQDITGAHKHQEQTAGDDVLLAQQLQQALAGPRPQAVRQPHRDHIELDPYQDAPGASRAPQTLARDGAAGTAPTNGSSAAQQGQQAAGTSQVSTPLALGPP